MTIWVGLVGSVGAGQRMEREGNGNDGRGNWGRERGGGGRAGVGSQVQCSRNLGVWGGRRETSRGLRGGRGCLLSGTRRARERRCSRGQGEEEGPPPLAV